MQTGATILASRSEVIDRPRPKCAPVSHSYASVSLYTGGAARLEQNGEWKLREGDVMLIPAGEPHRMLEMKQAEYWGLAFCVPCFAADGSAELLAPLERVRDGSSAVIHIPAERQAFLESLFRELSTGRHDPDSVQRSFLTLILAEIDRASGPADTKTSGSSVVVESLRFIERNCLRKLTLEEVAAAVRRTPAYVTTALTKATGRSAVEWIVTHRMAEARRLLIHSDERIEIIAEKVGYADATHFIRMFRRTHDLTPTAWRAKALAR